MRRVTAVSATALGIALIVAGSAVGRTQATTIKLGAVLNAAQEVGLIDNCALKRIQEEESCP